MRSAERIGALAVGDEQARPDGVPSRSSPGPPSTQPRPAGPAEHRSGCPAGGGGSRRSGTPGRRTAAGRASGPVGDPEHVGPPGGVGVDDLLLVGEPVRSTAGEGTPAPAHRSELAEQPRRGGVEPARPVRAAGSARRDWRRRTPRAAAASTCTVGVDAEHGRVEHQVVEAGVGRVDPEQPLDEHGPGPVRLALAPLGGFQIQLLVAAAQATRRSTGPSRRT